MKIIFSDVDGTIYPEVHDREILQETYNDIKLAQKSGVEFVICTGNAYLDNMQRLAKALDVRYVITSNGASIYDRKEEKFILKEVLPAKIANEILAFGNSISLSIDWWDTEKVYVNSVASQHTLSAIEHAITRDGNVSRQDEVKNDCFKIETWDTPEKVAQLTKFLEKYPELQVALMNDHHIEVTHKGVSKGSAAKWLSNHLGANLSECMAIGDSANDLPMFEVVGFSYSMDNGSQLVKSKSKYHTSDVAQNGLGHAIVDYLHRQKLDR